MRVRTRGFSPLVLLTRWRKHVRSRPRCTRKRVQHRRCQLVGSLVGHWVCNVPLWEHQSSALWVCSVPLRNTRPLEHDASPNARFLASWPLCYLAYNRKKTALTAPEGPVSISAWVMGGSKAHSRSRSGGRRSGRARDTTMVIPRVCGIVVAVYLALILVVLSRLT